MTSQFEEFNYLDFGLISRLIKVVYTILPDRHRSEFSLLSEFSTCDGRQVNSGANCCHCVTVRVIEDNVM